MSEPKIEYQRVWAEIDLDVIADNVKEIKKDLGASSKLMAVIKADAYGHGAVETSKAMLRSGADCLGAAICEEGVQLREHNISAPVLIFGYTPESKLEDVARHGLIQTVFSKDTAAMLDEKARHLAKKAEIHIKIDTGMSRLGFMPCDKSIDDIADIMNMKNLNVTGIYSHYAISQELSFTLEQTERFNRFVGKLAEHGINFPSKHMANSGGFLQSRNEFRFDLVRVGLLLYGLYPSGVFEGIGNYRPAMSLKTRASFVKTLGPGISIGYDRTYYTDKETVVATVPVGYADGYSWAMRSGRVLVKGQYAKIIGNICMDQFMVDVTGIEGVKAGDEIVLIGEQGGNRITADELARVQNTISYEVICSVGKRVPRVYLKNGIPVKSLNL